MATLPPGYRSLVALDRDKHRGLGVRDAGFGFARTLNCMYLTAAEFVPAARHYPIVFARLDAGDFVPVVALSLAADSNSFVDADGRWAPGAYIPAYARRHPFFVAGEKQPVAVDETALDAAAEPLFDATGAPTAAWRRYEALLQDMEGARKQTERLSRSVREFQLLEPFEAHAHPATGGVTRLRGLFRVDERKLNALPAQQLRALMKRGELSRIYAHLMSLDNFKALLDRTDAANGAGG